MQIAYWTVDEFNRDLASWWAEGHGAAFRARKRIRTHNQRILTSFLARIRHGAFLASGELTSLFLSGGRRRCNQNRLFSLAER